ncbi:MAG: zf-HC2 domain-containing protein [Myxococcota bacterium]
MGLACNEVIPRLVAWQDGELSPGEATQVSEHVAGCAGCARAHHRLAITAPLPPPAPPAAVQRRLAAAFDVDAILAAAEAPEPAVPPAPSWASAAWAHLARPSAVPRAAVLVYLALLAAALGWGASNWWALRDTGAVALDPAHPSGAIPASQFRPAAYDPAGDPEDARRADPAP